jgi:WD40 repeat protein
MIRILLFFSSINSLLICASSQLNLENQEKNGLIDCDGVRCRRARLNCSTSPACLGSLKLGSCHNCFVLDHGCDVKCYEKLQTGSTPRRTGKQVNSNNNIINDRILPAGTCSSFVSLNNNNLVCCAENYILMWDLSSLSMKQMSAGYIGGGGERLSMSVLKGGEEFAIAYASYISIRNSESLIAQRNLTATNVLAPNSRIVTFVVLNSSGDLACATSESKIIIWDVSSGALKRIIVDALAISLVSLNDELLAGGSPDGGFIRIWNTTNSSLVSEIRTNSASQPSYLAVLRNGNLVSTHDQYTIAVWDTLSTKLTLTLRGHTDTITALSVLSNGYLVSASLDTTIRVWYAQKGLLKHVLNQHKSNVLALRAMSDNHLAILSKETIRIWSSSMWSPATRDQEAKSTSTASVAFLSYIYAEKSVAALATLGNGDLVSGSEQLATIWSTSDPSLPSWGSYRNRFIVGDFITSIVVLSNGDLASAGESKLIRIWSLEMGSFKRELAGHTRQVTCLAALSNGYLASGSKDRTIRLWNAESGQLKRTISGLTSSVDSLAVLQNGLLASMSRNGLINIWNAQSGHLIKEIATRSNGKNRLAVLKNGNLVSTYSDCSKKLLYSIAIWDVSNEFTLHSVLKGHSDEISSFVALADGNLASASIDSSICIWDVEIGLLERKLSGHLSDVHSLALLNNRMLASGDEHGFIRIWKL